MNMTISTKADTAILQFLVPKSTFARLALQAAKRKMSMAHLVRDIVECWIIDRASLWRSKEPDTSIHYIDVQAMLGRGPYMPQHLALLREALQRVPTQATAVIIIWPRFRSDTTFSQRFVREFSTLCSTVPVFHLGGGVRFQYLANRYLARRDEQRALSTKE